MGEKTHFIILGVNIRLQNSLIPSLLKEKKKNRHRQKLAHNNNTILTMANCGSIMADFSSLYLQFLVFL